MAGFPCKSRHQSDGRRLQTLLVPRRRQVNCVSSQRNEALPLSSLTSDRSRAWRFLKCSKNVSPAAVMLDLPARFRLVSWQRDARCAAPPSPTGSSSWGCNTACTNDQRWHTTEDGALLWSSISAAHPPAGQVKVPQSSQSSHVLPAMVGHRYSLRNPQLQGIYASVATSLTLLQSTATIQCCNICCSACCCSLHLRERRQCRKLADDSVGNLCPT